MNDGSRIRSCAVFPFLKTSAPVRIGSFEFRSTDDRTGLGQEDLEQVEEISSMLYWRDELRLKSSAFAIVPLIDSDRPYAGSSVQVLSDLATVQAIVAYTYGAPDDLRGEPFLSSEHATMLVFTRASVVRALVFPDYNVESSAPAITADEADRPHVLGYHGICNFRDQFWVTKGSRVHGPLTHMTLNRSQDLACDFEALPDGLRRLVDAPHTGASARILTAMQWFNSGNAATNDDAAALMDLAIAFETLLGIPAGESKTERFVDAIALLLGRARRLDIWARQFYGARSNIAHEGRAPQIRFVVSDSPKPPRNAQLYHSLLALGRQVFQLCLRVISAGALLAERGGLEEKLVTNKERFERICAILSDKSLDALTRLMRIADPVQAIHEYKFASETGLSVALVVGAGRLAAQVALEAFPELPEALRGALKELMAAPNSEDSFESLQALYEVDNVIRNPTLVPERKEPWRTTVQLLEDCWMTCMWEFFRLERQRTRDSKRQ